jgi:periplasmic protein TonB
MQHPTHDILAAKPAMSRQRAIGLGLVAALHVLFVWALVNGLATKIVAAVPKELKAEVIAPTQQEKTSQTPPPPTLVVPKDAVTPPEIQVQTPQPQAIQTPMAPAVPSQSTHANSITSTHSTPPYPSEAKQKSHQGTVLLHIMITASGDVSNASVSKSSGFPELDQEAVSWVTAHWKYKPAVENGASVASASDAQVVFNLKNAS